MNNSRSAYYIGITIVVLSHAYILADKGMGMKLKTHMWLNLFAAALIAWGWTDNCMG